MKIIKLFDAFELPPKKSDLRRKKSDEEVENLIQLLNDIFLELIDDGFDIDFSHLLLTDKFSVNIGNNLRFKFIEIYETMLTAESHMKEHGYFLDQIEAGNGFGDYWSLVYSTSLYKRGLGELFDRYIYNLTLGFKVNYQD